MPGQAAPAHCLDSKNTWHTTAILRRMRLKAVAFEALDRRPTRWLLGLAGSAFAAARGERAWVTYDNESGGWLKRTPRGVTLVHHPNGKGIEQFADYSAELFLYDYAIGKGDVVVDVGAGVGEQTLPFSELVGSSGRVVAVEAQPSTFAKLQKVCRLNGMRNVDLVPAAVMDSDAPVLISDFQEQASYQENRIGERGIRVPAVTLSDLFAKFHLDHVDFLKMNIEGAEVAALRGSPDALQVVQHAAIECHDFLADRTGDESYRTKDAVKAILSDAGFNVRCREPDAQRPWITDLVYASR